jgi:hypothetical protein
VKPSVVVTLMGLASILSACSLTERFLGPSQPEPLAMADAPGQIEPIHAAAIADDQAVFWVSSNGCTRKADLTPVVRPDREGAVITLRRLKEDKCGEPRPQGVEISWSFQELGLEPGAQVTVENPYQLPQT